jgi:hypothetical protein
VESREEKNRDLDWEGILRALGKMQYILVFNAFGMLGGHLIPSPLFSPNSFK